MTIIMLYVRLANDWDTHLLLLTGTKYAAAAPPPKYIFLDIRNRPIKAARPSFSPPSFLTFEI